MKSAALALIRFYRLCLSPVLPSFCRYYPTCSAYAYEAVERYGVGRGIWMALGRVLRCRPGGGYGYDPVPEAEVSGTGCQVPGEVACQPMSADSQYPRLSA